MSTVTHDSAFYVTGGTIPPDSPSYVARAADAELLAALLRGELCYVLNARQMGKSSLCVRTRAGLEAAGTKTAFLDLQKFGSSATSDQWYRASMERIGNDLKLRPQFLAYWRDNAELPPLARVFGALRDVALEQLPGKLVVFLDEIDVVRDLSFKTDEFFGAIRAMHNARTDDPALSRITFCVIGTVAPSDLIKDIRLSPFNIGTRVRLTDLTRSEALPLAGPLPGGTKTLDRVLWWTNGHPYLTQRLCAELTVAASTDVDAMVARLFFAKSDADVDENVKNVRNGVLRMAGEGAGFDRTDLLTRYGAIVAGKKVPDDDTDSVCTALRLSGLVMSADGRLRVRNRIYAELFNANWVRENLPDAEVRRQRAAVARGRWQVSGVALGVLLLMAALLYRASNAEQRATRELLVANHLAYISDINLADQNITNGNYGTAQQFFDDAHRFPSFEHGYEWDYLQEKLHPERQLIPHPDVVSSVAYSPDGKRILTGCFDKTARIWDVATGKLVMTLSGHGDIVYAVAFSADGKRIVTGSGDKTARIWDAATGQTLTILKGHTASIITSAFSPDGNRIVTGSDDRTERVWDVATGRELARFRRASDNFTRAAFSPDGKRIVTGDGQRQATIWDPATGVAAVHLQLPLDLTVNQLQLVAAYSPDGKWIVTGGWPATADIWNAATGAHVTTLRGHKDAVFAAGFSPDGKRVVTGSRDRTVRIWDRATGKDLATLSGNGDAINSVAFSPDGKSVASACQDATVRIWDPVASSDVVTLAGHLSHIDAVAFSGDGERVALGSLDQTLSLWDKNTAQMTRLISTNEGAIYALAFSKDDRTILAGGSVGAAGAWATSSGRKLSLQLSHRDQLYSVAFSADGSRILTASEDETARIWDAQTGKSLLKVDATPIHLRSARFSPDGKTIVTAGPSYDDVEQNDAAEVWDAHTGVRQTRLVGHTRAVDCAVFSPDGKCILTGSEDRSAGVWDAATGLRLLSLKGHSDNVDAVAFSPDGKRILTGSSDKTARLWDAETGRELISLVGHAGPIRSVAFSPDGTQILTGSDDNTARIWRRPSRAQLDSMAAGGTQMEDIQRLPHLSLAALPVALPALAKRKPERRGYFANLLNNAVWPVVDPSKPHPSPEPVRDALAAAKLAVEYSDGADGLILDTLAAAQFASGDRAGALATERKAIALAPENKDLSASLKRYEAAAGAPTAATQTTGAHP